MIDNKNPFPSWIAYAAISMLAIVGLTGLALTWEHGDRGGTAAGDGILAATLAFGVVLWTVTRRKT